MEGTSVILVNTDDEPVGEAEKMEAHRRGLLHRAFSVFIFNRKGEMLLQRRAKHKYHSGGLWSNACCSHPSPGEESKAAAEKRLQEEMGFTTPLEEIFKFIYRTDFGTGIIENEVDHVFVAQYDGQINPDKEEADEYIFLNMEEIEESLQSEPLKFTSWFSIAFPQVKDWWSQQYKAHKFAG